MYQGRVSRFNAASSNIFDTAMDSASGMSAFVREAC
jgi:hypothetical protein